MTEEQLWCWWLIEDQWYPRRWRMRIESYCANCKKQTPHEVFLTGEACTICGTTRTLEEFDARYIETHKEGWFHEEGTEVPEAVLPEVQADNRPRPVPEVPLLPSLPQCDLEVNHAQTTHSPYEVF